MNGAFTTTATASNVSGYSNTLGIVDFVDAATGSIAYDTGIITESASNNGTLANVITMTLAGDTYANPLTLGSNVTVANVPAGLTAVVTRISNTVATLALTGTATAHANANDVSNVTVTFTNSAFSVLAASAVTAATKSDITVDYTTGLDLDADALLDTEEDAGYNGGDINNDGIPDRLQPNVGSIGNTVTGTTDMGIEVNNGCEVIDGLSTGSESVPFPDTNYNYGQGLASYELNCAAPGDTATVRLYFEGLTSTAGLVLRKFDGTTYTNITGAVLTATTVAGYPVVIAEYDITDGGPLDMDGTLNGTIVDPVGLGVSAVNFTSSSQTVSESVGTVTITASIPFAVVGNVTIPYTLSGSASGSDYSDTTGGTITIVAGNTTGTATFTITNDTTVESTETIILTMGVPTNAIAGTVTTHTISITDNDISSGGSGGGGGGGGGGSGFTSTKITGTKSCTLNDAGNVYRKADVGANLNSFSAFAANIASEGFITARGTEAEYEFEKLASRKEVVAIALRMKRTNGVTVSLIDPLQYSNNFTDIGLPGEVSWIQPTVETALKYGIISNARTLFEPERAVSRAEAFAMVMKSVCLAVPASDAGNYATWQEGVYDYAYRNGLTTRSWSAFQPESSILRQEIFVLASRAADWAEKTGGCAPRPNSCPYTGPVAAAQPAAVATSVTSETVAIPAETVAPVQQPGTFAYLYETDTEKVYSYIIKSGGIPGGVRKQYMTTFGATSALASKLTIRDVAGTDYAEDIFIIAGQTVFVGVPK